MSTQLYDDSVLNLTRYWGGDDQGVMVLVTHKPSGETNTRPAEPWECVGLSKPYKICTCRADEAACVIHATKLEFHRVPGPSCPRGTHPL